MHQRVLLVFNIAEEKKNIFNCSNSLKHMNGIAVVIYVKLLREKKIHLICNGASPIIC